MIPDHVARLLASSIETPERLMVLLHLRAARGKSFTAKALAAARAISVSSAENHLVLLCGRGFLTVNIGSDLVYAYKPVSPTIDGVLEEIERLYRARRDEVEAVLTERRERDPVHAFANAFLLRRDEKKGGGDD
jgi:hypothetical protein